MLLLFGERGLDDINRVIPTFLSTRYYFLMPNKRQGTLLCFVGFGSLISTAGLRGFEPKTMHQAFRGSEGVKVQGLPAPSHERKHIILSRATSYRQFLLQRYITATIIVWLYTICLLIWWAITMCTACLRKSCWRIEISVISLHISFFLTGNSMLASNVCIWWNCSGSTFIHGIQSSSPHKVIKWC